MNVQTSELNELPRCRTRDDDPELRPWKIAPLRPRERESDRNVKGGYRVPLPVSINVAGLFPDISRGCRAKIYLPLARNGNRSIPRSWRAVEWGEMERERKRVPRRFRNEREETRDDQVQRRASLTGETIWTRLLFSWRIQIRE